MKKFQHILILFLLSSNLFAQVSRQQSNALVLNQLSDELENIDIYSLPQAVTSLNRLYLYDNDSISVPYQECWVYFVDDIPFANWNHPCRYLFVNTSTGGYTVVNSQKYPDNWDDYKAISLVDRPALPIHAYENNETSLTPYSNDVTSVFSSDLDLDGSVDIIGGHYVGCSDVDERNTFTVYKNIGGGQYEIADTSKHFVGYQEHIFTCRIDEDEYPDLVTITGICDNGPQYRCIRVWYNDGDGNFNNYKDFNTFSYEPFTYITYGDANGDGLTDIFVAINDIYDVHWMVLYNLGNGEISKPISYYLPDNNAIMLGIIRVGDMNNDGLDDVVMTFDHGSLAIYYSTGDSFREYLIPDVFGKPAAIVDYDGDGYNDILTVFNALDGRTHLNIIKNNRNETFEPVYNLFDIAINSLVDVEAAADMNGDGLPDWIILSKEETETGVRILYNSGSFQLESLESCNIRLEYYGENSREICIGDFDSNGYNDIAVFRGHNSDYETKPAEFLFNDGNCEFSSEYWNSPENKLPLSEPKLTVIPNPFRESINLLMNGNKIRQVSVYNAVGVLVASENKNCMEINLSKLESGLYFVVAETADGKVLSQRIIKE